MNYCSVYVNYNISVFPIQDVVKSDYSVSVTSKYIMRPTVFRVFLCWWPMFSCTNQLLIFHVITICKQSDKDHSIYISPFLVVKFQFFVLFFSMLWLYYIYIKTTWRLVAKIICTKYSFIHAYSAHIFKEKWFKHSFIFSCQN